MRIQDGVDLAAATLQDGADLAAIIGVLVAIATLSYSLFVYRRRAVLDRVKHFASLKKEFLTDRALFQITELLEEDRRSDVHGAVDPCPSQDKWSNVPSQAKWQYIYFFEQVALLHRAGLIRAELACYMFGYYAVLCADNHFFWNLDFPKDKDYWSLFFTFVTDMERVLKAKQRDPTAFANKLRA
jgi:hypothetical protein